MSETILPKDDPILVAHHPELLARFPNAVFVKDDHGVYRFQKKPLMQWLCDRIDLNELGVAARREYFPLEEYMQFYQDIGYSLCGFEEVFGGVLFPEAVE